MATITSANSVFMLAIFPVYPVAQQLQGYMADAAFDTEDVDVAETVLGVDGIMSAGWVPYKTNQTISIMPDSASSDMFDNWVAAQNVARDVFFASATISLPGTGNKYSLTRGVLSRYKAIPAAKKVLEGRTFTITWGAITRALI